VLWKYHGQVRPPFADNPEPAQESVWDYPRPPIIVLDERRVVVRVGEQLVADSFRALRLLETASAPGFYLPLADVEMNLLIEAGHRSVCEWKGAARYFDLRTDTARIPLVAWRYPRPPAQYDVIADCVSFYPHKLECYVDGERVRPQPGGFYGGWVTADIAGPVKGTPGTAGW
jgi:uncharacterized protein (DUF427 family)